MTAGGNSHADIFIIFVGDEEEVEFSVLSLSLASLSLPRLEAVLVLDLRWDSSLELCAMFFLKRRLLLLLLDCA